MESMTDGVCIIRLIFDERGWPIDYLFVQANAAFQVQSGLSDPRGKTIRELVPGFEMHWIEKYAQVAASGVAARFEVEVLSIGGRYDIRAFVPRGFPPHHVAVVFTNTTERHLIESRLQASEERQAFVLKLQDRLRLLDDSDAIQLEAASALGLHLGLSRAGYCEDAGDGRTALVRRHFVDGVPDIEGRHACWAHGAHRFQQLTAGVTVVVPDIAADAELSAAEKSAYDRLGIAALVDVPLVKAGRLVASFFVHQDRSRRWSDDELALIDEVAHRTWAAVERAHAERALRQSEARLTRELRDAQLLQAVGSLLIEKEAPEQIFDCVLEAALDMVDADAGTIQLLDDAGQTLTFVSTRNFSAGMVEHFARVNASSGSPCGLALARGHRLFVVFDDACAPDPDGSNRLHLEAGMRCAQSTPLVSRSGRPLGMFSTHWHDRRELGERELRCLDLVGRQAADLIERMQVHAALQAREHDLREEARRKDEFIAVMAHELRNPLAPIRNGVELLLAASHDHTVSQVAPMMARQVGHMVKLVDDLLDVSRINSGRVVLKREPIQLGALVAVAVEANRGATASAGLELRVELDEPGRVLVVDPTRLAQILSNILHNATKFTPTGGTIVLSATAQEGIEGQAAEQVFRISDTGRGMSLAVLPTIFELFTQANPDSSSRHGGMGIGLALARRLAELHGGRLDASSGGAGLGSEFVLRIPLEDVRMAMQEASPDAGLRVLDRLRILVVDDNEDAADSIALLLAQHDGDVEVVYGMAEAMRVLDRFEPELVLLDLGMPGIDGYEGCRLLRQARGSTLHIAALTGWGQEDDRQRTREAGFDGHLTKPVDLAKIMEIAQTIRDRPAGRTDRDERS